MAGMHRDTRTYYEDPSSQFATGQYAAPGGDYSSHSAYHNASYDYQQTPAQHYSSPHASDAHPYYRSMTPGMHSHRYSNSASGREYYSSSGVLASTSSLQQSYNSQGYYPPQYPNGLDSRSPTTQTQFIPTPSEMAQSYTSYIPAGPHSPPMAPESYGTGMNGYTSPMPMLPQSHNPLRPSRISTGRPRTASGATTSPTSATSPSGERFPCEKCGKTFSRSHDRKRHHETQHLPTPVIHRCRYCEKEFSRADSLKRHLDNGCDEMPQ